MGLPLHSAATDESDTEDLPSKTERAPRDAEAPEVVRVQRFAREVRTRIVEAIADTERGALQTGECIGSILDASEQLSDDARAVVDVLSKDSGLFAHLEQEREAVGAFSEGTNVVLEELGTIAERMHVASSGIQEVAEESSSIADSSRLLTINAQIEAARAKSKTFAVIAQEMQEFTKSVRVSNERITTFATSLLRCMPQLIALLGRFRTLSGDFDRSLAGQHDKFMEIQREIDQTTDQSLQATHDGARRILDLAQEALASLQFQDPVRQSLERVDRLVDQLQDAEAEAVTDPGEGERSADFNRQAIGDYYEAHASPEEPAEDGDAVDVGGMLVFGLDD